MLKPQYILPLDDEHIARFQSLVQRADGDACWTWAGNRSKRRDGSLSYGRFCIGKQCQLAHRVAWLIANGPIPADQVEQLRAARAAGETFASLGERFGVHPSTAHSIATGATRRAA